MKRNRKAYLICDSSYTINDFCFNIPLNSNINLWVDDGYELAYVSSGEKAIFLYGLAVDSHNPELNMQKIVESVFDEINSLEDCIKVTDRLGGHYVVILKINNELTFIPDACATMGVYYTTADCGARMVSSNARIIADVAGFQVDPVAINIKKSTNATEAFVNDITYYREIKVLLPNNYLKFRSAKPVRFPVDVKKNGMTLDDIISYTGKLLANIIYGLSLQRKLSLPLTGGVDSRTILACAKDNAHNLLLYTYRHDYFSDCEGDLKIPKQIAEDLGLRYIVLPIKAIPEEMMNYYCEEVDPFAEKFTPTLCYTYSESELKDYMFLSGGIAPIGKSVYGRTLPEIFALPSYFCAKAHNSSKHAKKEINKWVKLTKPFAKQIGISLYDLFYWEFRCGRWDSQTHLYTDAWIEMVSPYNCREILMLWLTIPREIRNQRKIHLGIIEKQWPELLKYPINPDIKITDVLKKNKYVYLFSVYGFWIYETARRLIDRFLINEQRQNKAF